MITLGTRHELFLDGWLIDTMDHIELGQVPPERKEKILELNKPWEGRFCTYLSVVQPPGTGQIYMYYRATDIQRGGHEYTCLAISDDGIHFKRFENGLNNIVVKGITGCHNFAPFYDTNPDCAEGERFKAVAFSQHSHGEKPTLSAFHSQDGIEWHLYEGGPIIEDGVFDSLNTAFWDESIKKYRCYSRYFKKSEEEIKRNFKPKGRFEAEEGLRGIQSSISDDFRNWSAPVPNTYNGREPGQMQSFYTNAARPVPGAPHQLVAFPMRFHPDRQKVPEAPNGLGCSDCVMLSSRDGIDWQMRSNRAWIYPNMDRENWTNRNYVVSAGIAEAAAHFNVYVMEHYGWDDISIVRYAVPKMRLGYVYSEDGSFITRQFVLEGDRLTFNYNTSAFGTLYVTVLDENKKPIEGYEYEIFGNEFAFPIVLKELKGRKLHLSIKLQDAYLYSIGY